MFYSKKYHHTDIQFSRFAQALIYRPAKIHSTRRYTLADLQTVLSSNTFCAFARHFSFTVSSWLSITILIPRTSTILWYVVMLGWRVPASIFFNEIHWSPQLQLILPLLSLSFSWMLLYCLLNLNPHLSWCTYLLIAWVYYNCVFFPWKGTVSTFFSFLDNSDYLLLFILYYLHVATNYDNICNRNNYFESKR